MILHIFNKQEKFSYGCMKFIKDSGFDMNDQRVFHYGKSSGKLEREGINVCFSSFINPVKHIRLYKMIKKSDRVIIHSLASPFLLWLLLINSPQCKKFYWIIWGKDLYFKQCVNMKNPVNIVYEWVRKKALKHVKHVVTYIRGDYEILLKWYKPDAELVYTDGILYPYNTNVSGYDLEERHNDHLVILLGNSGSVSNNHLQAIDLLKQSDDGRMEIICPLSYGGKASYAGKVAGKGQKLFGNRFKALIDFMPLEEYNRLLASVDVAFFFHDRQEAFMNTLTLLKSGKKVYIRPCSTVWDMLKEHGITVFDSEKAGPDLFETENDITVKKNKELVEKFASAELAKESWEKVFK